MSVEVPPLVPARMLNEYAYCPRLAYLEWVQGDFVDSVDTVEGRFRHRQVDRPSSDEGRTRAVELSAPVLGLIAKMDLLEIDGRNVVPVDYKRGEVPRTPGRVWEPERVQLCAQALILEENGYQVERGEIYFVGSKTRVEVPIDDALRARTLELLAQMRASAASATVPPPLVDSPKCPRCSLVGICLPDETNALATDAVLAEPRKLVPARDDRLPVYVQSGGTHVGKRGDELVIEDREGNQQRVRTAHASHVALHGGVQISTQALQDLCGRNIPVTFFSHGGWFYGMTVGTGHKNVELRQRQFRTASDSERSLAIARRIVNAKIRNCRTLVRRGGVAEPDSLRRLRELATDSEAAESMASLLGIEGVAARIYFGELKRLFAGAWGGELDFDGRNRRPPRDPINALLSLGYALLTKDFTIAAVVVGFDPYLGFYHQPRYGKPALALDLMEEFRPLIVDSAVLSAVNTGALQRTDFVARLGAVALTDAGRSKFIAAYERRMSEEITHPIFGYKVSYRRILEVQVRLLARYLGGEIPSFPPFCTR